MGAVLPADGRAGPPAPPQRPRRVADEEDVVVNAFDSFCRAGDAGRYPDLGDRHGLWQVLLALTINKSVDLIKHAGRDKRTRRRTVAQSEVPDGSSGAGLVGFEAMLRSGEPAPAFATKLADHLQWLLGQLGEEQLKQIVLLKLEGHTNPEIADQLRCAVSTVERRLRMIRKRLEGRLDPDASAG